MGGSLSAVAVSPQQGTYHRRRPPLFYERENFLLAPQRLAEISGKPGGARARTRTRPPRELGIKFRMRSAGMGKIDRAQQRHARSLRTHRWPATSRRKPCEAAAWQVELVRRVFLQGERMPHPLEPRVLCPGEEGWAWGHDEPSSGREHQSREEGVRPGADVARGWRPRRYSGTRAACCAGCGY